MVKEIILSKSKITTFVDDEDYEMLNKYTWNLSTCKYPQTNIWINNKRTTKQMHLMIINPPRDMCIDHIDGNIYNNQKSNLRVVTIHQNTMNSKSRKGTSKFKGVSKNKKDKKWVSKICFNYKTYILGYFENEKEAAITYNKKAIELFGEYANLNEVN